MAVRILIADDHRLMRQGLKSLLEKNPEFQVVGEAETGRQTVSLVRDLLPDVVILDVEMPDGNGVEACQEIQAEFPQVKVVALSVHADSRFVTSMLRAGAQAYLLKDCAFEDLVVAIRWALNNRTYLSSTIGQLLLRDSIETQKRPYQVVRAPLTRREKEILRFLAEGKRSAQIASLLKISVKTVESHRQQIMNKLGTRSIAELTKFALREGLTTLDS